MSDERIASLEARIASLEAVLGREPVVLCEERLLATMVRHAGSLTGIPAGEMLTGKKRGHCQARFAVMHVARETLGYSTTRIANAMRFADHTTVINGLRRAQQLRESDPMFRVLVERLLATFRRILADPDLQEVTSA